jgi:hypothetical protein
MNPQDKSIYSAYNLAIKVTEKHTKKSKSASGEFYHSAKGQQFLITYEYTDQSGHTEIQNILL